MSKQIPDLELASQLQKEDQFLFFQNSTKKTKRVSRANMFGSPGVIGGEIPSADVDTTPPATPSGLTVTSVSEKDRDGTEKVYIKASITANSETDLASYGWSIRRVSGTPTFTGSNLTGYSEAQIFGPTVNVSLKDDENAIKMSWEVRANTWYEVKVCAIDKSNNASGYTALTTSTVIQSAKDTTPPAAPTSVSATSAIKSVFLTWTNPTDADLAYINIYRATSNTPPVIGTTTPYAKISSNSYVDSNTTQGTTYYYWLTSVDVSGNETATTSTVVSLVPGLVAATDITNFAVDATKMFTNTIILKNDATWVDNSNNGTANSASGYIYWSAHTLVYKGVSYSITAGSTNSTYVYWTSPNTTYSVTNTNPTSSTLGDDGFIIATNTSGSHDLAWNSLANAVIGTAYIQNAAITNAKVNDLAVDKLTSGSINAQTLTLIGSSIIKSSTATDVDTGTGLFIRAVGSGTSGTAEFAIGDFAGTNYGYLKWKNNTLSIKGAITATSLTLSGTTLAASSVSGLATVATSGAAANLSGLATVATSGLKGDVGLGNVSNLAPSDQTTTGIESSITINTGGITMGTGGFVQGGIAWSVDKFTISGTGFFLGRASNQYRFFLGQTGTTGLGGTNYLYWDGSSLAVRGAITATSLTLSGATVPASGVTGLATVATSGAAANLSGLATVATSGLKGDVGLGSVSNLTPQNQAQTGIEATITINSGGVAMGTGGYVRGNIDWSSTSFTTSSSGFYLGYAGSQYRFFIGQTGSTGTGGTNYLYWNGSILKIGGNIVGGTTIGSSTDAGAGLTVYSPYGIRKGRGSSNDDDGVLTFTGGEGNGVYYGAQIDLVGSVFYLNSPGTGLLGDDGSGTLQISAGYRTSSNYDGPLDGAIVFRTLREENALDSGNDNHGGAQRFRIELDGTVRVVYTGNATSTSDIGKVYYGTGAGTETALNTNPGRFLVEGSTSTENVEIKTGKVTFATDTNLYRHAADKLGTDDDIVVGVATNRYIYFYNPSGRIVWSNTAGDLNEATNGAVNLYRGGSNMLKTDDDFVAASVTTTSARRTKKNIKSYKGGLDIVQKLKPVSFNRKIDNKNDIGFIAEDVDEVLSMIVAKNENGQTEGLDYSKITVVLVNAIKELKKEIDDLKGR